MSPLTKEKSSKPKFLLDENVDVRLGSYLKKQGFSVSICPKGLKNGAVFSLAQRKSCILLTNDKDFANPDLFKPSKQSAIIVFRIHPPKLNNLIKGLSRLLSSFTPNQLAGKLVVLGEEGLEIIKG